MTRMHRSLIGGGVVKIPQHNVLLETIKDQKLKKNGWSPEMRPCVRSIVSLNGLCSGIFVNITLLRMIAACFIALFPRCH